MDSEPATAPEAAPTDADSRVQDGEKQHRIRTTRGVALLFRALVSQGGWYTGAKEFSRARKLAKAIGSKEEMKPPEDKDENKAWGEEPYDFWLSERLRDHGKKCLSFFLEKGAFSSAPDDEAIEPFLLNMGISLKDD